jgi:hypothetical protein
VSYGWGKSQLRRQGSKAKDQRGRGLDNLQKQVRRFYIYQKLKVQYFDKNNFEIVMYIDINTWFTFEVSKSDDQSIWPR